MRKAASLGVALLAIAAAVAHGESGVHGAADPTTQQEALAKLGLTADPPRGVDPAVWARSIPADNAPSPERIELGRRLYFDRRLSKDGTVACATCHDVMRSFTDRRPVSEGIDGKLGRRNAPTTLNVALLHLLFWDGRAASLEEQAGQPILNPIEMGQPDRATVEAVLRAASEYPPLFQKAYGHDPNYADLQRAIAAFERTLNFLDAPFDRFVAGDANAISADARAGWNLFNGKARCAACHALNGSSPLGTDNRFHNIGVSARKQDFETLAKKARAALEADESKEALDKLALASDLSELGRFVVTRNTADIGSFRTEQLRNIGVTAPYMHDGSLQTLWDVLDHYNKGGEANPYLDGGIEALDLSETEIDQVVAFLFTLTDDRFAALNAAELERQRAASKKTRPFRDDDLAHRKVVGFEKRVLGGGK